MRALLSRTSPVSGEVSWLGLGVGVGVGVELGCELG